METLSHAELTFLDSAGAVIGNIHLYGSRPGDIVQAPPEDCERFGEEPIQLIESGVYEYSLDCATNLRLSTRAGGTLLTRSSNPRLSNCGRLETRGYVGRLPLFLMPMDGGEPVSSIVVEVRSQKLGYRDDIRQMLSDIADEVVALALDHRSPTELRIRPDPTKTASSLYQRYAVVSGLLRSPHFHAALNQIIFRPNSSLRSEAHEVTADRIKRLDRNALKQFTSGSNRSSLPKSHPLSSRLSSLSSSVRTTRREPNHDTQENQFVRFVLEQFSTFLATVEQTVCANPTEESRRLQLEANALLKGLAGYLCHPILMKASCLTQIPLNSPVLQRREGYREVLQAWMKFDACASITWHGAEDVFGAGQQNTAVLYEYWVFFKLLALVNEACGLPKPELAKLFTKTTDGLSVNLRRGKNLAIKGQVAIGGKRLELRLDYNRTFRWSPDALAPGSWTRTLRPDYTISVWMEGTTEKEAEADGSIAHLHFDAKYRLDELGSVFCLESGSSPLDEADSDLLNLENSAVKSSAKATDLLKMHAYKDAIRRSVGSFVLYPGTESIKWSEFHELLPGLGAFVVKPGGSGQILTQFLADFLSHYASGSIRQGVSEFISATYGAALSSATHYSETIGEAP